MVVKYGVAYRLGPSSLGDVYTLSKEEMRWERSITAVFSTANGL